MQARQFLGSKALSATVQIRLMAGWVFMSEGIQKFLVPDALGIGRFTKIGIPAPQFFAAAGQIRARRQAAHADGDSVQEITARNPPIHA
jgi:uncharacterized membrane protein YphA (DoxX/SURF4 family)